MSGEYDILLNKPNLVTIQQVIATDTAVISLEELDYMQPSLTTSELEECLEELENVGYVRTVSVDTPDGIPDEYYAATPQAQDHLQELGLWDGMAVLYQAYQAVEVTDRIQELREYYPEGLL